MMVVMAVAEPTRFRWTTTAFEQAAAAGVFGVDPRCELVDGEVLLVNPMLPPHARAVRVIRAVLYQALLSEAVTIGSQEPVVLSERDEPEPDVWVARGTDVERRGHPQAGDLLVVIEVAQASLVGDLQRKVPRYAAAGVPDVVVVDVIGRRMIRNSDPDRDQARYRQAVVAERGESLEIEIVGVPIVLDVDAVISPD